MQWFRFYSEAMSDIKLRRVARLTGESPATVLGIWVILLSIASDSPERGLLLLSAGNPATIEDIEDVAGCNVSETLLKLIETGLVTECTTDYGKVLCIPAWEKRQFESDTSTKRVQELRKRRKGTEKGENETFQERSGNVPETDTETDTEEKKKDADGLKKKAQAPEPTPPAVVAPPQRTDTELTQAISAKLTDVGVGLSVYIVDTYVAAAQEFGIHAALGGIQAAADKQKQHTTSYVLACIRNKASGDSRKGGKPTNGYVTSEDQAKQQADLKAARSRISTAQKLGMQPATRDLQMVERLGSAH
jgi:hypothetical protein